MVCVYVCGQFVSVCVVSWLLIGYSIRVGHEQLACELCRCSGVLTALYALHHIGVVGFVPALIY